MVQNHEKEVVKERKEKKREREWKKREVNRREEISFKVGGEAPKEGKREKSRKLAYSIKYNRDSRK